MHQLIYSSQAREHTSLSTLVVLLMQARALNERKQITGALLYSEGHFLQVMEGEESVIRELYERVARDPRHHDVCKLVDEAIATRSFSGWSMAFGEVPAAEFEVLRKVAAYQTPAQLMEDVAARGNSTSLLLDKIKELVQSNSKG